MGLVIGLILCGELAVLQAPLFDGLSLYPFALFDDGFGLAKVGIGGCHVVQALMVSPVIVVFSRGASTPSLTVFLQMRDQYLLRSTVASWQDADMACEGSSEGAGGIEVVTFMPER